MVGPMSSEPHQLGVVLVDTSINREPTERSLTPYRPLINCHSKCSWGALLYCMSLSTISLRYLPRPTNLASFQGCDRTKDHPRLPPRCWSKSYSAPTCIKKRYDGARIPNLYPCIKRHFPPKSAYARHACGIDTCLKFAGQRTYQVFQC